MGDAVGEWDARDAVFLRHFYDTEPEALGRVLVRSAEEIGLKLKEMGITRFECEETTTAMEERLAKAYLDPNAMVCPHCGVGIVSQGLKGWKRGVCQTCNERANSWAHRESIRVLEAKREGDALKQRLKRMRDSIGEVPSDAKRVVSCPSCETDFYRDWERLKLEGEERFPPRSARRSKRKAGRAPQSATPPKV